MPINGAGCRSSATPISYREDAMRRIAILKLSLIAASSLPFAAFAQTPAAAIETPDAGIPDIIVTATKRNENLQNVPVAITAITTEQLTKQGVFSTADLNGSIPNLQVGSAYGETQPNFTVRGIGVGTEYNSSAVSPVGIYVDEVYQSFRASHGQQLYDLEQVEVVRGPQGTLFGRNTTGGAINFITRKPRLKDMNGYGTFGYGSFNAGPPRARSKWRRSKTAWASALPEAMSIPILMCIILLKPD